MEHLDFELEIGRLAGPSYPVSVIRSPAGEAHGWMRFPYDELALAHRLQQLQIALLSSGRGRRRVAAPNGEAVQQFGQDLFKALFDGDIRSAFDVSRREAQQHGKGLRIKLRFETPEMASLPWEFLYDPLRAEYLCLSVDTPLVRYLELPMPVETLEVVPPLRILGMVASPRDLPELDVERERLRVEEATRAVAESGTIELHWIEGQSWRDLSRSLRRGPWHVFHFIGHGLFDEQAHEGAVALTGEDGRAHLLPAPQLGRLLGDHHPLRLVLLNSCEGARGSDADVFSSTAATLVRRGTPAVLAMQYEITDLAAIELARSFYEAIAEGWPVDSALAEARKAVCLELGDTLEWGTPVLYMRSASGVLFHMTNRPATPPAPPLAAPQATPPLPPIQGLHSRPERAAKNTFCRTCGRKRLGESRFCGGCGQRFIS